MDQMTKLIAQSPIARGNREMRNGNYEEALRYYEKAISENPMLASSLDVNRALAMRRLTGKLDTEGKKTAVPTTSAFQLSSTAFKRGRRESAKVAIVVHYYYEEIWRNIKPRLEAIKSEYDLFITVPAEKAGNIASEVMDAFPAARVQIGPNLGMDIISFLSLIPILNNEEYTLVCKLQTKKGDGPLAAIWRDLMLDTLIGSTENLQSAVEAFDSRSDLYIAGPAALYQSGPRLLYDNGPNLMRLTKEAYGTDLPKENWGFFAGTMFWARVDALLPMARVANFAYPEIDSHYKKDGKVEHALERMFGLLPRILGGKVGLLHPRAQRHEKISVVVDDSNTLVGEAHIGDVVRQISRMKIDHTAIESSGLFDEDFYLSQNKGLCGMDVDLIYHYLTQGRFAGKLPARDLVSFNRVKALMRETGDERDPLLFYIEHGGTDQKVAAYLDTLQIGSNNYNIDFIRKTGLFDIDYYLQQVPRLRENGSDPLEHYLQEGTYDERYPSRHFIPREYRALNPDVVKAGFEPFYHYLKYGAREARRYRSTRSREESDSPFFRYVVLNRTLIDWESLLLNREENLVSIIIPVYGQHSLTRSCIESLLKARTGILFEIICVDNGSDIETKNILAEIARQDQRLRILTNTENYNFALGCNIGFAASHGSVVVFLNNDTTVSDGWLDQLILPLSDKNIVAVQPKLLYPDGTIQNIGIVFAPKQTLGYPIYAGFSSSEDVANLSRDFQAVTAACIAVRAEDFASVQGFDPLFINGQEDVDLCLRLKQLRPSVCRVQATSLVTHHESKTPGRGKFIPLNRKNFISRWKDKVEPDDFMYYAQDKYRIIKYVKDNDEMVKQGIGISRPVLKKSSVTMVRYNWDSDSEAELRKRLLRAQEATKDRFKSILVTVIMPTYNRSDVIADAIDSVLSQTHQNFELLICDDGSTDGTKDMLAGYLHDRRVRYLHLAHEGVSAARNAGLNYGRGEVIAYLDTDNIWDQDFLRLMLVALDTKNLGAAYSAIRVVDDYDHTLCYRGDVFDWTACLEENYIDLNCFVHTRAAGECIRFDNKLRRLVDWDFILNITKGAAVSYVPFVGVKYYDGGRYARITRTEYIESGLSQLQDSIRAKHVNNDKHTSQKSIISSAVDDPTVRTSIDDREFSLAKISTSRKLTFSFRIKIGCPTVTQSAEWGDYHFADAIRRSLIRYGHSAEVDCLDKWDTHESLSADIVLVLRGLSRYRPKEGQINIMWSISHPDKVELSEYQEYDHIFVASNLYSYELSKLINIPVSPLLQCTDPEMFNPGVSPSDFHPLLFVGNSRNVYRKVVKDCIEGGLPVSIYGTRWRQFIDSSYIRGDNIPNSQLPAIYCGAGVILNDHWETMRKYGFISNRLFDAVACGAMVISDDVVGLSELFGRSVIPYETPIQLAETFRDLERRGFPKGDTKFAFEVGRIHSFDARVAVIIDCVDKIEKSRSLTQRR